MTPSCCPRHSCSVCGGCLLFPCLTTANGIHPAPPVSPDPQPDPSPFQDVSTWEQGDRLRSSGGELAVLLQITRQRGPGRSAKVWVEWAGADDGYRSEYYADVFTNETRS